MNNINQYVESYKENFNSPVGAYAYLLMNQRFPELFVISSNEKNNHDITPLLEKSLKKAKDLTEIMVALKEIEPNLYKSASSSENSINQKKVLKVIENIELLDLPKNDWSCLNAIITFNNFGPFINNNKDILNTLNQLTKEYSLESFSLNPNFKGEEFLKQFKSDIKLMCDTLEIQPEHIGLNSLEINYQTEEGDFSGYMGRSNDSIFDTIHSKMVIKKPQVFAHEWLHFVDAALGFRGHNLTCLMEDYVSILNDLGFKEIAKFEKVLNKNIKNYSEENFGKALASLGHFLEKYALDKEKYYQNLEKIGNEFSKDKLDQSQLVEKIKNLLDPNYPPRYFSFINAQCEIYQANKMDKKLKSNQMVDFSNMADKHLGERNYTVSLIETFARTFESYLGSIFNKNNKECSFVAASYKSDLYPQGEYKNQTDDFWKKGWKEIKKGLVEEMNRTVNNKNYVLSNIGNIRNKLHDKNKIKLKPN